MRKTTKGSKVGKTIAEKILAKAGGKKDVSPGEYVFITSTSPIRGGEAKRVMEAVGAKKLSDPKMIIVCDDHSGPGGWNAFVTEDMRANMWKSYKELGIPRSNIFINKGIAHVMAGELCWAKPGTIYISSDGHTPTVGGIGALALCLSHEMQAYAILGKTWLRVPESIKFILNGKLQDGVMSRDITDFVLGQIGPAGSVYKVMEWTGPVIDDMSMDGRFAICNDALHSGGMTGIVNPDRKTIDYVEARTNKPFEPLVSDPNATYAKTYTYDVSALEPQIAEPPYRWHVKPVKEFTDVKINRGFIGSCFTSRMEDMRIAARILKGRKLHPDVRLNITPGSQEVLKQAAHEGIVETFIDAGVEVHLPSCSMCGGFTTPLAAGDVCVSTSTCNYPGRMGNHDAQIYLGNPATVAASAVEGRITDPRKYL